MGSGEMPAWLRAEHGPALTDLAERTGAELAWASSWAHEANSTVGVALGLRPAAKERFLARREPSALLIPVDPAVGITGDELAAVERWHAGRSRYGQRRFVAGVVSGIL